jgi:GT2 family glycosyltransferase
MLGNRISVFGSKRKRADHLLPRTIYAPHCSFVIFNRKYFETGGTLKHGAFLFGEEIFVAETVRNLGFRIIYDPRFFVLHREHATTSILKGRKMLVYLREANDYCVNQFFL